jgi:hypothetical protein
MTNEYTVRETLSDARYALQNSLDALIETNEYHITQNLVKHAIIKIDKLLEWEF